MKLSMPRPTRYTADGRIAPDDWRYWGPFLGIVALAGLLIQPIIFGVGWAWGTLIKRLRGTTP